MSYEMPFKADEKLLYGHVASLPCQRCGRHGVQVSHSNQLKDGKWRGIKAYPWRVAALCMACHDEIDKTSDLTKAERREAWDEAHRNTVGELFARGLLRPTKEK